MYRPTVSACIFNEKGQILSCKSVAQRRIRWQFVQGGIEKQEAPIDALKRELFEEIGLHANRDYEVVTELQSGPDNNRGGGNAGVSPTSHEGKVPGEGEQEISSHQGDAFSYKLPSYAGKGIRKQGFIGVQLRVFLVFARSEVITRVQLQGTKSARAEFCEVEWMDFKEVCRRAEQHKAAIYAEVEKRATPAIQRFLSNGSEGGKEVNTSASPAKRTRDKDDTETAMTTATAAAEPAINVSESSADKAYCSFVKAGAFDQTVDTATRKVARLFFPFAQEQEQATTTASGAISSGEQTSKTPQAEKNNKDFLDKKVTTTSENDNINVPLHVELTPAARLFADKLAADFTRRLLENAIAIETRLEMKTSSPSFSSVPPKGNNDGPQDQDDGGDITKGKMEIVISERALELAASAILLQPRSLE